MRSPAPLFLAALTLLFMAGGDAMAQVERGGGLFSRNRNTGQISAGLFPDDPTTPPTATRSSRETSSSRSPSRRGGGLSIFRSGRPEPVEATSYVIADGERIPVEVEPEARASAAPVATAPAQARAEEEASGIELATDDSTASGPSRRLGFLTFGRRSAENEAPPLVETIAAPPAPPSVAPAPVPVVTTTSAPAAVAQPISSDPSPAPEEARERRLPRLALPFGNRRSRGGETAPEIPDFSGTDSAPLVAEVVPPAASSTPATSAPARSSSRPAASGSRTSITASPSAPAAEASSAPSESAAPAAASSEGERPEFVINAPARSDLPSGSASGNERGGITIPSIPNPISAIRPSRPARDVDLSNAETIIQDGEIVQEGRGTPGANDVTAPSSASREAPRTVDGVTTYSSWDDVGGRSVSAADRILNQLR